MTVLNRAHTTVREYQAEETSSYLKAVGGIYHKPLKNATVVIYSGTTPELSGEARRILEKLEGFKQLGENWDTYQAAAPTATAIRQAEKMVRRLDAEGAPFFFTAPGPNGEIVVELKHRHKTAEIYFYTDEPSDFVLFDGDQSVKEGFTDQDFHQIIDFIQY